MALLAGIDEAGYGPLLGPLVISATAFRVPDQELNTSLWETLREVCVDRATRGARLVIADSKAVYRPGHGLGALERGVLVSLAAADARPASWRGVCSSCLRRRWGVELDGYPWYCGADQPLPSTPETGDIGTRANALRRACAGHHVTVLPPRSAVLLVGQYNHLAGVTRNKAMVLLTAVQRLLAHLFGCSDERRVRVYVDRLGGRLHYREALMTAFPGFDCEVVEESEERSAYRLRERGRVCELAFVRSGDRSHFPVALASMVSKYVRELCMGTVQRVLVGAYAGAEADGGLLPGRLPLAAGRGGRDRAGADAARVAGSLALRPVPGRGGVIDRRGSGR